jgi:hypothetical protein
MEGNQRNVWAVGGWGQGFERRNSDLEDLFLAHKRAL